MGVAVREGGSWKLGGGCIRISIPCSDETVRPREARQRVHGGWVHTCSNVRPPSTISVTACRFPPVLWRFQAIVRRSICGNMLASWSMWAGLALRLAADVGGLALAGLNHHRAMRTVTARKTRSCGMLSVCSAMAGSVCLVCTREQEVGVSAGAFSGAIKEIVGRISYVVFSRLSLCTCGYRELDGRRRGHTRADTPDYLGCISALCLAHRRTIAGPRPPALHTRCARPLFPFPSQPSKKSRYRPRPTCSSSLGHDCFSHRNCALSRSCLRVHSFTML